MFNKFIQTSAIAAALALGGAVAFAQTGSGSMQDQQQQVPQQQGQTGQSLQGQGQGQTGMQGQQQGALKQQEPVAQQSANPSQNLRSVKLSALDSSQIKEVQTQLKDLGFYKGAVDGVLGNVTRTALIAYFNTEASLARQGKIADQSLTAFGFNQQLQDARLSTQRDIASGRNATSEANNRYRVDHQPHPTPHAAATRPPQPSNVVATIMQKKASGQPLTAAESATMNDYVSAQHPSRHGSSQLARPNSRAEFNALPSGTSFIDPDGNVRVKP